MRLIEVENLSGSDIEEGEAVVLFQRPEPEFDESGSRKPDWVIGGLLPCARN